MKHVPRPTRNGLTLLELMLALSVTAMVAAAVWDMMGAVTAGVSTRRDNRSTMVRAAAAATRLSAYVAPSRCLLAVDGSDVALWLNDRRESETVHATEIRWLVFDPADATYEVYIVAFPESWTQAAKDLEDKEYLLGTNWMQGWTASLPLVDGVDGVSVTTDAVSALNAEHINFNVSFQTSEGAADVWIPATIRLHQAPSS